MSELLPTFGSVFILRLRLLWILLDRIGSFEIGKGLRTVYRTFDVATGFSGVESHEVLRFAILAGVPCPSDSAPEIVCF